MRRGSNCLGPALKALECSDHARAPETRVSGQTFLYCTSRESLRGADSGLEAIGPRTQSVRAQLAASHRKHPIVGTGSVLPDNGVAAVRQLHYNSQQAPQTSQLTAHRAAPQCLMGSVVLDSEARQQLQRDIKAGSCKALKALGKRHFQLKCVVLGASPGPGYPVTSGLAHREVSPEVLWNVSLTRMGILQAMEGKGGRLIMP